MKASNQVSGENALIPSAHLASTRTLRASIS